MANRCPNPMQSFEAIHCSLISSVKRVTKRSLIISLDEYWLFVWIALWFAKRVFKLTSSQTNAKTLSLFANYSLIGSSLEWQTIASERLSRSLSAEKQAVDDRPLFDAQTISTWKAINDKCLCFEPKVFGNAKYINENQELSQLSEKSMITSFVSCLRLWALVWSVNKVNN